MAQHGLARVARARGDLRRARQLCHTALAACPGGWVTDEETRARIHITLGEIARSEGNLGEARLWLRRALGSQNLEITSTAAAVLDTLADTPGHQVRAPDTRPSTM
jgi:uncharacterized protein HemY